MLLLDASTAMPTRIETSLSVWIVRMDRFQVMMEANVSTRLRNARISSMDVSCVRNLPSQEEEEEEEEEEEKEEEEEEEANSFSKFVVRPVNLVVRPVNQDTY